MFEVTKEFIFDAAHYLPGHETCGQMHGHTYRVLVTFEGMLLSRHGMLIDFGFIKEVVGPLIDCLDHSVLNTVLQDSSLSIETEDGIDDWRTENPTAENLAYILYQLILGGLEVYFTGYAPLATLKRVTVYETPTSYASYTKSLRGNN